MAKDFLAVVNGTEIVPDSQAAKAAVNFLCRKAEARGYSTFEYTPGISLSEVESLKPR